MTIAAVRAPSCADIQAWSTDPEIDAEAAITAAIAEAEWEIRKKALRYFALGLLVALICPAGALLTGYLSAKLGALSVVGAAVSLYGLLQMLFAVGHTVDTASD